MSDVTPNRRRGEVLVVIDGDPKIIRFSLAAQAKILDKLDLKTIEEIPDLIKQMNPKILVTLVSAALTEGHEMSEEELMVANLPTFPTITALINAVNLATWGTTEPVPFDAEKGEESPSDGALMKH